MIRCLLIAAGALLSCSAPAQTQVYGSVGTTGLGAGVGFAVAPKFGLRFEANIWRATAEVESTDVDYAGTARFRQAAVLADWYPEGGRFRFTAGLAIDGSRLDAVSTAAKVTVNGRTYVISTDQLTLAARLPSVMQYLGIGFGLHPGPRGWSVFGDLGAYLGRPDVWLTAAPGLAAVAGTAVEAEAQRLRNEADRFSLYPVLRTGAVYRF